MRSRRGRGAPADRGRVVVVGKEGWRRRSDALGRRVGTSPCTDVCDYPVVAREGRREGKVKDSRANTKERTALALGESRGQGRECEGMSVRCETKGVGRDGGTGGAQVFEAVR